MFNVTRKRSDSSVQQSNCIINKEKPKFKRCVSIARLFGNAYSTNQQHMSGQKNDATSSSSSPSSSSSSVKSKNLFKNRSTNVTNKSKLERFKNRPESQMDHMGTDCVDFVKSNKLPIEDFCDEKDLSARAFRTISKGLGLIWKRSYSVEISTPDPEYKVFYLGNVLTGWAKGDNCIEKPLATLWRNYTQINKPDVTMRILVCSSGLKATTRQHGLTEYWSNRITYCCSPKNYPRVFCWIYRHEGRKLKHELRCHAVLCPKESIAEEICKTLKENLSQALKEFKRDKINRQNARLSLVNSLYENPSMPRRKILLSVGANNYRPPMERSKSAPKLMAIEEAVGEEEEISSAPIYKKSQSHSPYYNADLFTTATFDRKYCKRNKTNRDMPTARCISSYENSKSRCTTLTNKNGVNQLDSETSIGKPSTNLYDEDDDFNNLLMTNDYDIKSSLSGEILSYFDTKLSKSSSSLSQPEIDSNPNGTGIQITADHLTNGHDSANVQYDFDSFNSTEYCSLENANVSFNQSDVLSSLVMSSSGAQSIDCINTKTDVCINNNISSMADSCTKNSANDANVFANSNGNAIVPFLLDSDEGSITSGCETSSIITTAHMDDLMKSEREIDAITVSLSRLPLKHAVSNLERVSESDHHNNQLDDTSNMQNTNEEDSEFSDESGFDENNIGKTNNNFRSTRNNCALNAESTCSADANNNIKHTFSSNTTKTVGRLMFIPKNAKSIDI